jgi:hypothetical protein
MSMGKAVPKTVLKSVTYLPYRFSFLKTGTVRMKVTIRGVSAIIVAVEKK